MKVLLMRHGIAVERDKWRDADELRPLTQQGIQRTRQVLQSLKHLESRLDLIACSPLTRAAQTAALAGEIYQREIETWPELENADFAALANRLPLQSTLGPILLIGHEPGLSRFAAQLLGGRADSFKADGLQLDFKKAAICALEVDFVRESASLLWFAPPRLLRKL